MNHNSDFILINIFKHYVILLNRIFDGVRTTVVCLMIFQERFRDGFLEKSRYQYYPFIPFSDLVEVIKQLIYKTALLITKLLVSLLAIIHNCF